MPDDKHLYLKVVTDEVNYSTNKVDFHYGHLYVQQSNNNMLDIGYGKSFHIDFMKKDNEAKHKAQLVEIVLNLKYEKGYAGNIVTLILGDLLIIDLDKNNIITIWTKGSEKGIQFEIECANITALTPDTSYNILQIMFKDSLLPAYYKVRTYKVDTNGYLFFTTINDIEIMHPLDSINTYSFIRWDTIDKAFNEQFTLTRDELNQIMHIYPDHGNDTNNVNS